MSIEAMKLTDPYDHPEPHTMKWTQTEMDYINNRVENAVRLAIEQAQKQEPVAWTDLLKEADEIVRGKVLWKRFIDGTPLANDIAVWMADFAQQHTSPPPRQPWAGLTDEDKQIAFDDTQEGGGFWEFADAIEATLRKKNHG